MKVNQYGYIVRRKVGVGNGGRTRRTDDNRVYRDWYFVKFATENRGYLALENLYFPKEYIGKKVKLKVEVIEAEIEK